MAFFSFFESFTAGLDFSLPLKRSSSSAGILPGFLSGADLLAAGFLATGFLAAGFLAAADFLAAGFLAAGFLAAGFLRDAGTWLDSSYVSSVSKHAWDQLACGKIGSDSSDDAEHSQSSVQ